MTTVRKFKKLKAVTLPLIKLANNKEYYFKFIGAMHRGKVVDDKKEAPMLAHVVDLETGEEGQIICGAVLHKELSENYEGDSYVGKCFEIVKQAPEGARKYSVFAVTEVAEPEPEAPAAPEAKPADDKKPEDKKGGGKK